jgi:peptidylprolyl isomerase/peptidyl-prolyl cis-trans isomerase D
LPNDSVAYEERDLRRFYDDNREEFARERSYTFRYVTIDKSPTPADTAAVINDLSNLRDAFAEADDDSLFVSRNGSEVPYADAYFRPDELDEAIANVVFADPAAGAVLGPIVSGNQVHLIKVVDSRPPDEPAVRARHILFRAGEGDDEARAEARRQANDVLRQIRGGADFAEMAREYSSDGSASSGGDLGWFGPGRMVAPFEEAAFAARLGRPVGPVETQFGFHLIEVTDRASVEAKIVDFALDIRASIATLTRIQEQLEDLQYFAEESEDFDTEALRRELTPTSVQVEDGQNFIAGLGNSTSLRNFLETADTGDISPVIELNEQFIVGVVESIQSAGYRPFEEVRAQIEPRVRNEKKAAIQRERLEAALAAAGGFEGLASSLGEPERTASNVSFQNMVVPTLGRDPLFAGSALGLTEGETSDIIEGENGVYVIHVTGVNEPNTPTDAELSSIRTQLETRRQQQVRSRWLQTLRADADIVDNRRQLLLQ